MIFYSNRLLYLSKNEFIFLFTYLKKILILQFKYLLIINFKKRAKFYNKIYKYYNF